MKDSTHVAGTSRRSALHTMALGVATAVVTSGLPRLQEAFAAPTLDEAVEWARKTLPNSTADIIKAAAKEGHLTLTMLNLGGDPEVLKDLISGFNERYPFIVVNFTMQSTVQLLSKFNAELAAKKGITDYINFPSNLKTTASLNQQGAILPFVISEDAAFPNPAKNNGLWYAWRAEYPATAYRKGALSEEEGKLVRSYEGLGDRRFKSRLGIGTVANSVSSAGCYTLLAQADRKVWQGLADNKPHVKASASALLDGLLAGEYDVSLLGAISTNTQAALQGAPVEFGVSAPYPTVYTPGGISAIAPHPNAAKLWQDWVMSAEGQRKWAKLSGAGSTRSDIEEKSWAEQQPWFFKDPSRQIDMDWDDFAKTQPEIEKRFKADMQAS